MEQALQDAEARLEKTVQRGQIVSGKVVLVTNDGVMVDIGARTEAIIPFNQLTERTCPKRNSRTSSSRATP
jgi:small subunit ribosomal protein S1